MNSTDAAIAFDLQLSGRVYAAELPAHAIASYLSDPTDSPDESRKTRPGS